MNWKAVFRAIQRWSGVTVVVIGGLWAFYRWVLGGGSDFAVNITL